MTDQSPMSSTDAKDAARYRWIKAQKNLTIRTNRTYGPPWTNTDTEEKYYPSHQLNINGTGFNGIEHFDDLIDQAMKMYPLKSQKEQALMALEDGDTGPGALLTPTEVSIIRRALEALPDD